LATTLIAGFGTGSLGCYFGYTASVLRRCSKFLSETPLFDPKQHKPGDIVRVHGTATSPCPVTLSAGPDDIRHVLAYSKINSYLRPDIRTAREIYLKTDDNCKVHLLYTPDTQFPLHSTNDRSLKQLEMGANLLACGELASSNSFELKKFKTFPLLIVSEDLQIEWLQQAAKFQSLSGAILLLCSGLIFCCLWKSGELQKFGEDITGETFFTIAYPFIAR